MIKKLKVQNLKCKAVINSFKVLKFYVVVLSFAFLVLSLPASVHAQAPTPIASSLPTATYQLPATVSPTSPIYTDLIVHNMFHTFSCLLAGSSVIGQPCLTYKPTIDNQGLMQTIPVLSQVEISGGLLGTTTSLIGALYDNPPIRTVDYVASVGKGFGIVRDANAQVVGSGASILSPILALWQVSRNIAYLIMTIIFLVIGLMVMFRQRINPQTVINAQAALPGLILGLILITFSYFIAAIISDTAFIGTNLVGAYFSAAKEQAPQNLVEEISGSNVMSLMGLFLNGITKEPITDGVGAFFNNLTDPASRYVRAGIGLAAYQVGSSFGSGLGALAGLAVCGVAAIPFLSIPGINIAAMGGVAAAAPVCASVGSLIGSPAAGGILATGAVIDPPAVAGVGLWFIAMLAVIYSIFRLMMKLINNFLNIVFLVITAPFHFLIAALPGRQGIANAWILNLLGNVLVFPAVLAVFYFIAFLLGQSFGPFKVTELNKTNESFPSAVYAADKISVTGNSSFPLFGGLSLGFINVLLAFGALVGIPAIPDIIVRSIGKAGQAGQLIGQEVNSGISGGQRYYGQAQGGLGSVQKDVSGLRGFGSQREYHYDETGKKITGIRIIPGLGSKFNPPIPGAGGHSGGHSGPPTPIKP